ncbi:DUF932 domain-containing protein [Vibrio vulnificus]
MKKHEYIDIEEAYFPVEKVALYRPREQDVYGDSFKKLPRHSAIVDIENEHVFSVVTDDYNLITNQQAVNGAKAFFEKVFSNVKFNQMKCLNITTSSTRSFCHIDLVHENSDFTPWEEDSWTPFIRITNSYNKTKKLVYEIGFCRWICMNGLIFGSKSVKVSTVHSRSAQHQFNFDLNAVHEIATIEAEFIESLHQLKRYHVPRDMMFPLTLKVFNISIPEKPSARRFNDLTQLWHHIQKITDRYFIDGQHGYSALNVLTDYATRPLHIFGQQQPINQNQMSCGSWVEDFIDKISDKSFTFEDYLETEIALSSRLEQQLNRTMVPAH